MMSTGGNRGNNSNNNRLSFDASKTGSCKLARTVREGCGSTELGVCNFVLGTYPQRGSAPLPQVFCTHVSIPQSLLGIMV